MFKWLTKKIFKNAIGDNEAIQGSVISQMGNGIITVNGKRYKGNSVIVANNEIYIDGVRQDD